MESWVSDIEFERLSPVGRAVAKLLINPLANYAPAGLLKALLRYGKSELAAANWADPGGWRSMVLAYDGRPRLLADRILIGGAAIPMGLRNRKRLGARLIARLIDEADAEPVHVLCLGAGPGHVIIDAFTQANRECYATLVDLNPDAFDYGRKLAGEAGVGDKVRFVAADVRDIQNLLSRPPHVVKMLGICEYLDDEHITAIGEAVAAVMPPGAAVVLNSLSKAHGTDRFFRRVFGLHMIHRSAAQLQALLAPAGFGDFVSICEPLGVYEVVVGRRLAAGPARPPKG